MTVGIDADTFYTSAYIGVLPEDILQDLYAPLALSAAATGLSEIPFPLPSDDDRIRRALASFDRNSTVDGHKIGVIYMSDGQTKEADILQNTVGSATYTEFISNLGTLVRLKGATFNTQGLDRSSDQDGAYAYCWRDRATEIVFHVTTMMPTDLENDPMCINKKAHIGNDYVNIVWNDSGTDFKFDTFPSQFNYVYIVITPEHKADFVSQRLGVEALLANPDEGLSAAHEYANGLPQPRVESKYFYKVQVISAPGFPLISPAAETKMLSGRALAPFVRLIALNASFFSLVWAHREGGEHVSPWRNRLREIIRLREKYGAPDHTQKNESASDASARRSFSPHGLSNTMLLSPPGVSGSGRNSQRASLSFMGNSSANEFN